MDAYLITATVMALVTGSVAGITCSAASKFETGNGERGAFVWPFLTIAVSVFGSALFFRFIVRAAL